VKVRAARLGRACDTREALIEALFVDGVSTRDQVSAVSGRGVGLAALRQAVQALDGAIEVDSTPGKGTVFRFTFDETVTAAPSEYLAETMFSEAVRR
jgi:two-component system chemotaxis sensor kinase CheA